MPWHPDSGKGSLILNSHDGRTGKSFPTQLELSGNLPEPSWLLCSGKAWVSNILLVKSDTNERHDEIVGDHLKLFMKTLPWFPLISIDFPWFPLVSLGSQELKRKVHLWVFHPRLLRATCDRAALDRSA